MEGLIFPSGILSQWRCCSCIPREWVTAGAGRQTGCTFFFFFSFCALARLVQTVDRRFKKKKKKDRPTQAGAVWGHACFFCFYAQDKHTQRWAGQSQDVEHKTLSHKWATQVFRLAENFLLEGFFFVFERTNCKICFSECIHSVWVSQWCAQMKCRHWILCHFSGLVKVLAHGLKIPPETGSEVIW